MGRDSGAAKHGKRKFPGEESSPQVKNVAVLLDQEEVEEEYLDDESDLPLVNDLDIAADAAAGLSSQEDSSDEETSESESENESEESSEMDADSSDDNEIAPENSVLTAKPIKILLSLTGGAVSLKIESNDHFNANARHEKMTETRQNGAQPAKADDEESVDGSDIADEEDYQRLLAHMLAEGEDSAVARREVEAECARLPTVPLDIHVLPDEAMAPAGEISGILEGDQIIIQAPVDAKVLDEGSVLCLEDRHLLGKIEEILGPVAEPLYFLRYAGKQPMPENVCQGARVSCLLRFSTYLLDDDLQAQAKWQGNDSEADEQLSEDDAEVLLQQLDLRQDSRRSTIGQETQAQVSSGPGEQRYRNKLNAWSSQQPRDAQPPRDASCQGPRQPHAKSPSGPPPQPAQGGRWVWMPEAANPSPPQNAQAMSPISYDPPTMQRGGPRPRNQRQSQHPSSQSRPQAYGPYISSPTHSFQQNYQWGQVPHQNPPGPHGQYTHSQGPPLHPTYGAQPYPANHSQHFRGQSPVYLQPQGPPMAESLHPYPFHMATPSHVQGSYGPGQYRPAPYQDHPGSFYPNGLP